MRYQFTSRVAAILLLAALVMGLAISGTGRNHRMRSQLHGCAVVGFIACVALRQVAGQQPKVVSLPALHEPASTAARESLYQALREMDLPPP